MQQLMEFKQHITDLTLYGTSSRHEHIFEFFDEPFVEVLLNTAEQLYSLRTGNEEVAKSVVQMFNGLIWSMCNYIGSGREFVSSRYLGLLLEALQNPNQTMKGNILASLGTLSEYPHFLQLMLNAGVLR